MGTKFDQYTHISHKSHITYNDIITYGEVITITTTVHWQKVRNKGNNY